VKPQVIIALLLLVVATFVGVLWVAGFIRIGAESVNSAKLVFEQLTARDVEAVGSCLAKDYSGGLTLTGANSPSQSSGIRRLRNRALHIVIDVSPNAMGGSVVRVFKRDGSSLSRAQRLAIESCIPENGLPPAGDPRNQEFYVRGE
jgi:hypothetical protein